MEHYFLNLVGIPVLLEVPFTISAGLNTEKFICNESVDPQFYIRLHCTDSLPTVPQDSTLLTTFGYTKIDDRPAFVQKISHDQEPRAVAIYDHEDTVSLYCTPESRKWITSISGLLGWIGFETLLFQLNSLILHASFVKQNEQGILFTAPSGTGKSTQAELWENYEGAEIINGDRAGLRKTEGGWTAWGLPYAGSSGIYRNESAPISAVVVLRQAKENRIRRLTAAESLRYIYPELSIHRWDPDFVDKAVNLYLDLAASVPVYLLECLPDQGAVQLLKKTLTEEGVLR